MSRLRVSYRLVLKGRQRVLRRQQQLAYDEQLAERIRSVLRDRPALTERRMFGGIAFMIWGNMCCGINGDELMLRLGAEGAAKALEAAHTREMDFTGRPMKGMLYVEPEGFADEQALAQWVNSAADFAAALPQKKKKKE